MSKLIIKDKISQLRKGYPTVSDKYNIAGGILDNADAIKFGELVAYGSAVGYYVPAVELNSVDEIAGVVVATNVKLNETFGDSSAEITVKKGEAFNLLIDGYVAVELDADHTAAQVLPGKKMAVILATGKLTTIDKVASGIVEMPGYYFTGIKEGNLVEIEVRR